MPSVRLGIARSTVQDNLARASAAGVTWPLGPEVSDAMLEQHLSDLSHGQLSPGRHSALLVVEDRIAAVADPWVCSRNRRRFSHGSATAAILSSTTRRAECRPGES
jgi:hypothetical protein